MRLREDFEKFFPDSDWLSFMTDHSPALMSDTFLLAVVF